MKVRFDYCIWLVLDDDTHLESKNFLTHITIKSNLNYLDAFLTYQMLQNKNYIIEIDSELIEESDNYFKALYFRVKFSEKNKIPKPKWWPENAHISVSYKYGKQFTSKEKNKIFLKNKELIFNNFILMECNGHHLEWKRIN